MRRISSVLMALMLAAALIFSAAACGDGGTAPANGGTDEPAISSEENISPLLTGMSRAVSGDSYKKINGTKYKLSTYSCEEIGIAEAEDYPKLSEALKSISSERISEAKAINKLFKQRAAEYIDSGADDYGETHFSYYLRNRIARSDEICFSFLECIQSYSGGPHPNSYTVSHNINPKTGKEYKLSDVFDDLDALIQKTSAYIFEKYGEDAGLYFDSENTADLKSAINAGLKKSFFKKITGMNELGEEVRYYSPSWVLTGQGVSLIFDPYAVGPYALGSVRVDFTYSELEGIINDRFVYEAETYVVPALLDDGKTAYDYDRDGQYDELEIVTDFISSESDNLMIIGELTVKKGDMSITRDCGAYSIMPYIVHMSDGSDYLYISCENFYESYIMIFNITGDFLEYIGRQGGSLAFGSITNPSAVHIADRLNVLSTYSGAKLYKLLNNGKFATEDSYYEVRDFDKHLVSSADIGMPLYTGDASEDNLKEYHSFPAGTEFEIIHTDGKTFADLRDVKSGLTGRFYVTMAEGARPSKEGQYFKETGEAVKDVFEELYFAD